jgi:polyphosphate:AMP phosphotransferase
MFEAAELGQEISPEEYDARVPALREALLLAQDRLQEADFPVLIVFAGVDGAGKGETANLLSKWLDPRWVQIRAFDEPTQDEIERPEYWRFWGALPRRGRIGIYLNTWYSRPLLERVVEGRTAEHLEARIDEIVGFERALANDGALFLKLWLHLGVAAQEKRFREFESDPLQSWRVTERDWHHWRLFEQFAAAGERLISRTSTGFAPWHIIEGWDARYRGLRAGEIVLGGLESRLAEWQATLDAGSARKGRNNGDKDANGNHADNADKKRKKRKEAARRRSAPTILSRLDLGRSLEKEAYRELRELHQGTLNGLQRRAREQGVSTVLVFQGWDAAGKGGAIRRIVRALDARWVRVHAIGVPSDEELDHHYLWRFWRRLPRDGQMVIFDRSWYGRVLVERVEGLATEREWRRAYAELNAFEEQIVGHGTALAKFFIHIDPAEQKKRFAERAKIPYKRYKLTAEDWRNRERWGDYEVAVHDMVERTSTRLAPWTLVEGNDKRYARVKVLETVCKVLAERLS